MPTSSQGGYSNAYGPPGGEYGPPGYQQSGGGYGGYPQNNYPQNNFPPGVPGGSYPSTYPGSAQTGTVGLRQIQSPSRMNLVFFAGACCLISGSLIGFMVALFRFGLVDVIEMAYIFIFGVILAVLDTPFFKTIKAMGDFKMYIGKYINILLRVTGKGLAFLFLGSDLFCVLWELGRDDEASSHVLIQVFAVLACFIPVVVGLAAIVIGIMKSWKLQKARKHIEMAGTLEQRYNEWAQTYRDVQGSQGGLTPLEFNQLTMDNGGFKWEDADLKLIFNALVSNPAWRINAASTQGGPGGRSAADEPKIPKEDLMSWVKGGMVFL